jgi:hypothetical protein
MEYKDLDFSELGEALEVSRRAYEVENDEWWNNLTQDERENAFYAVCKRIHKAELEDKGSYRYALYDIFVKIKIQNLADFSLIFFRTPPLL